MQLKILSADTLSLTLKLPFNVSFLLTVPPKSFFINIIIVYRTHCVLCNIFPKFSCDGNNNDYNLQYLILIVISLLTLFGLDILGAPQAWREEI